MSFKLRSPSKVHFGYCSSFIVCKWYEISCKCLLFGIICRWYFDLFNSEIVIRKHLSADFGSLCEWFTDYKLSIHWEEIELSVFRSNKEANNTSTLNVSRNKLIKQYSVFKYFQCLLDKSRSKISIAKRSLKTLRKKYRQNRNVKCPLKRMSWDSDRTTFWFCMLRLADKPTNVTKNNWKQLRTLELRN